MDNYRGISLLPMPFKILLIMVTTRIEKYLEKRGILAREQAGFRRAEECAFLNVNLGCFALRTRVLIASAVPDSTNIVVLTATAETTVTKSRLLRSSSYDK